MGYTSIVCAVTGSEHSQKAAMEAAELAKRDNAALTFVYAADAEFFKKSMGGRSSSDLAEDTLEHIGKQVLGIAEQNARSRGVTPKKIVRRGSVLDVLKQVVREEKAELLVMGHEDRSFFDKMLFDGEVEEHIEELKKQTGAEVMVVK